MVEYKTKRVSAKYVAAIVCDVCKKRYEASDDECELQEFLHVNFVGGYGSVFGDGSHVTANICQKCLKERLGDILAINTQY